MAKKSLRNTIRGILYKYRDNCRIQTRITKRKLNSLKFNYSRYQKSPLNLDTLPFPTKWEKFMSYKKIYAEIGTGHGELLADLAILNPQNIYVGFEITKLYAKKTFKKIAHLNNAFAFKGDAYYEIPKIFKKGSLDGINILFPDPWHKKRHHKRRPINSEFFREVYDTLVKDGEIFVATDWEEYFDYILDHADMVKEIYSIEKGVYAPDKFGFPVTHYYKKWLNLGGRKFQYIRLRKIINS